MEIGIVGAGITGLTAAYELGKAGYDCHILEAKDRPGGRNWTVRGGTTETDLDGRTQRATFSDGVVYVVAAEAGTATVTFGPP